MNRGLKRPSIDHRDYDFLKSHRMAGVATPIFPDEYTTDAGLWMPDQDAINPQFPDTGPEPYGCTNYAQTDLTVDLTGKLFNPMVMESVTHANALGGYDIRQSLLAAKGLGYISNFFNVRAIAPLDFFDAIRLASLSGLPEKRSVSIGTPWYTEWQAAAERVVPLMPMPKTLDYTGLGWHNWKVGGWKMLNGAPVLRVKPWEGKDIGDAGWLYFPREVINAVMGVKFTIAFTATRMNITTVTPIDLSVFDTWVSILKNFLGLRY